MKRLLCALSLAAFSCSPDPAPLTQLMVVVDSNLPRVDAVSVTVRGMDDGDKTSSAEDLDERPLPRTVAVVHRGGKLGPITVTAAALVGGRTLLTQRARVSFESGRNMMLRFDLDSGCVNKLCAPAETCKTGGVCGDYNVDDLEEWPGSVPESDAGVLVGGSGGESGGGGAAGSAGKGGSSGGGGAAGRGGAGSGGSTPVAGSGGMSAPPMCTSCEPTAPHATQSCDDGVCTLHCEAGYTDADRTAANGCEHRVTAFGWKPSNFDPATSALLDATVDKLTINCSGTLDFGGTLAQSVSICGQQLQPVLLTQSSGTPELVAIAVRSLQVTAGSKFSFSGSRPVVIVVYGDADIEGELDVSAVGATGAAGSNTGCDIGVGGSGTDDADSAGGGGGGGFGTPGGDGATPDKSMAPGGAGGQASAEAMLSPLRAGCGGGAGGLADTSHASGGAGGGALQLSAAGGMRIKGVISAAGGGGKAADGYGDGGGGGGSGGAILLEASTIELLAGGWLTANGGGGGAGRVWYKATAGSDGAHSSSSPAAGGGDYSLGGPGAAGDVAAVSPTVDCLSSFDCGGGGGGGGAGRVVLRANTCQLMGGMSPTAACSKH